MSAAAAGKKEGTGQMDIGDRIRRLRKTNGLTLQELADRSELTKGFLSQVERNLTSPSIATLIDILEALGTTPAEFFREDREEQIVFTSRDFFVKEEEDYGVTFIVPNAQKNRMEPIVLTLKGGGISPQYEPMEAEEFGYVLAGKIELHYGSRVFSVRKGQSFYFPCDQVHYLKNPGSSEAKVIWVTSPPSF